LLSTDHLPARSFCIPELDLDGLREAVRKRIEHQLAALERRLDSHELRL
jgi:hypothetical protein